MSKSRNIIKWSLITFLFLIAGIVSFGIWFMNLIPKAEIPKSAQKEIRHTQLPYLTENIIPGRGKILAVVTSTKEIGQTGKKTGYELSELARAYYVFEANGFTVEVASPKGGEPPVVIDADDMKEYDYAFLNDSVAKHKIKHTIAMANVNPADYEAVYFVGGKGAMFDFPNNPDIQSMVRRYYESGKVVGAVCHGPAALVNVQLSNGQSLLADKTISSFTNEEELLLIPKAKEIFPFMLQERLTKQGANFNKGIMYLNKVSIDGNLVTGQNPWSTWEIAESMIRQLGYDPKPRIISPEENSISVLETYETKGYSSARQAIDEYCKKGGRAIDRELLGVHSLLAAYQLKIGKSADLIRLLKYSNVYLDN